MENTLTAHPLLGKVRQLQSTWGIALAVAVVTYLYLLAQFPTGNHDWARMAGLEFYSYQVQLGRWLAPAVYALSGFRQLPVLNALLALTAYVSAGFATCFLIESVTSKEVPRAGYLVAGLLCALIPWNNWTFYYSWMAAMAPISQLICVAGLTLVVRKATIQRMVLAGLVLCASLATYQSAINTAALLFWLVAILLFPARAGAEDGKQAFRRVLALAGSIVLGAGLYTLSLSILRAFDLLAHTYHFRFITWQDLPARVAEVVIACARHFVVPHPFFSGRLKLLLLGLTLVGILALTDMAARAAAQRAEAHNRSPTRAGLFAAALVLLGVLLMVFCSKIQFLVTEQNTYFYNRFASFGLTFVYVSLIVIAISHLRTKARQLYLGVCALALWTCIVSDLSWQDAYVKQNEFDKRFIDRVIARIESLPEFSYDKAYDLVHLGGIPNVRDRYYDYSGEASPYHKFSIMPGWAPENPYVGLEPRLRIRRKVELAEIIREGSQARVDRLMEHIRRSQAWPHESSVAIVDGQLVVLLSKQGVGAAERQWRQRSGRSQARAAGMDP